MKHILKTLSLSLILILALSCTNKTVEDNLALISTFTHDLISSMKQKLPTGAERFKGAENWLARVDRFKVDYALATNPDAQAKLLPALAALTDGFSTDILSLVNINPVFVAGIDTSLRFIVRHFKDEIKHVQVANDSMSASGELQDSAAKLDKYLKSPKVKK